MHLKAINPWQWQNNLGYAQAISVQNKSKTLYCSGQAAMDADGRPVSGTMAEQLQLSLQNLEKVIDQAGYEPSNIVCFTIYTTSVADFFGAYATVVSWFQAHKLTPCSTLVEVAALAFPDLSVEIQATVVG